MLIELGKENCKMLHQPFSQILDLGKKHQPFCRRVNDGEKMFYNIATRSASMSKHGHCEQRLSKKRE
jgi:hypothetical protein